MTRRDYRTLARAFKRVHNGLGDGLRKEWLFMVGITGEEIAKDNANFDPERFLKSIKF